MSKTLSRILQSLTFCRVYHAIAQTLLCLLIVIPAFSYAEDADGVRLLLTQNHLRASLPEDTRLLDDADIIERFLEALDGTAELARSLWRPWRGP